MHVAEADVRSPDAIARRPQAGGVSLRLLLSLVVLLLVAAGVGAGAWRYFGDAQDTSGSPDSTVDSEPADVAAPAPPSPQLSLREPTVAPPVLAGIYRSRAVSAAELRSLVTPELRSSRLGRHVGFTVAALGTRPLLMSSGGPDPVTPASTLKLLTTSVALSELGPEHRFVTSVVAGANVRRPTSANRQSIVLVGGGDPLLTEHSPTATTSASAYPQPATLEQLAARTAHALKGSGVQDVTLGYDDFLFAGPAINPHWKPSYVPDSVVSPISPLWVNEGRRQPGFLARVADPARDAAVRFASLLTEQGLAVHGSVMRVHAPRHPATLAEVRSAPLAQIVERTLELSDNEAAEVLLRQVAIASGRPGSSAVGVQVERRTLTGLGIDIQGAVIEDGSGLSRDDRLPVDVLVRVLQLSAEPGHPELRAVISSLPVAGFNGSLGYRFVSGAPAGLGVVRAKTGTLTGVHALAGTVSTRAGKILVFAAVADQVPVAKTLPARAQLERVASALAACGC